MTPHRANPPGKHPTPPQACVVCTHRMKKFSVLAQVSFPCPALHREKAPGGSVDADLFSRLAGIAQTQETSQLPTSGCRPGQQGLNNPERPLRPDYFRVGGISPTQCLWEVEGHPGGHGGGCLASSESDELARPYTSGTRSICGAGEGTLDAVWMVGDGRAIVMVDQ